MGEYELIWLRRILPRTLHPERAARSTRAPSVRPEQRAANSLSPALHFYLVILQYCSLASRSQTVGREKATAARTHTCVSLFVPICANTQQGVADDLQVGEPT
jgi:hypothetical protein